jgi:hypothetical protein
MFKTKSKHKKFFIIIFSILCCISLLYFISGEIVEEPICTDREFNLGWDCWFESSNIFFVPPLQDIEYKKKCEREGGEYHSMVVSRDMTQGGGYTLTRTGAYLYCIIPFSDYGNSCTSSNDCKGCCEYIGEIPEECEPTDVFETSYECSNDLLGTCSKLQCRDGSGKKTVERNVIHIDTLILY